jgi:hypothetical protein
MSRGKLPGRILPGGYVPRGILPRGILTGGCWPGAYRPGEFRPDTAITQTCRAKAVHVQSIRDHTSAELLSAADKNGQDTSAT